MKKPYMKFYGRDWLGDPSLRMVSPAVRGVWIDLLCAMSMSEPYGHLAVNGAAMQDAQAARMTGMGIAEYQEALATIEAAGISSRTPDGVLYSRRLVREHAAYAVYADAGRKGGNPALSHTDTIDTPADPPCIPPAEEKKSETRSQKPEATQGLRVPLNPTLKPTLNPTLKPTLNPTLKGKAKKAVDRLDELKATYTPLGVDVDRELAKCRAWCIAKNLPEPTYMRLVNWLNRCDKPVQGGAPVAQPFNRFAKPDPEDVTPEVQAAKDNRKRAHNAYLAYVSSGGRLPSRSDLVSMRAAILPMPDDDWRGGCDWARNSEECRKLIAQGEVGNS